MQLLPKLIIFKFSKFLVDSRMLRLIFKLIGLDSFSAKLLDDLTINCSLAENLLGWERKHKIESGIKEMLC